MLLIDFCDSYKTFTTQCAWDFRAGKKCCNSPLFGKFAEKKTKKKSKYLPNRFFSSTLYWNSFLSRHVNRKRKISSGNRNNTAEKKNNGGNTTIEMAFNWHEIGFIRSFDIWFHNAICSICQNVTECWMNIGDCGGGGAGVAHTGQRENSKWNDNN